MVHRVSPDERAKSSAQRAKRFADCHDDGQEDIAEDPPDVILVGISQTGKTALAHYLAETGLRVANIPVIDGQVIETAALKDPDIPVFALTARAETLIKRRRAKMGGHPQALNQDYCRVDCIRRELLAALGLFQRHHWHVVDASHRSLAELGQEIHALLASAADGKR